MAEPIENCLHLEGLRVAIRSEYRCPVCGESMDLVGVARWVRDAEKSRDEAYSMVEGDGFEGIAREELQREVYRRRRVMYELENVPRVVTARPEMILVVYDVGKATYECRIFYKEPRPAGVVEQASVGAAIERILELRSDADPVVRLISDPGSSKTGRRRRSAGCSTRTSSECWQQRRPAAKIYRQMDTNPKSAVA
jgi:hypothetical protein